METYATYHNKQLSSVSFGHTQIGPHYWVGIGNNGIDYYAGQTFKSPASGLLKTIRLYSSLVYNSGRVSLSIYEFDAARYLWKQQIGLSSKFINKSLEKQWIDFDLDKVAVENNVDYAFKISCTDHCMLAIAECPWNVPNPYVEGVEWIGSSMYKEGSFQTDFDLAFEGEIDSLSNAQFI